MANQCLLDMHAHDILIDLHCAYIGKSINVPNDCKSPLSLCTGINYDTMALSSKGICPDPHVVSFRCIPDRFPIVTRWLLVPFEGSQMMLNGIFGKAVDAQKGHKPLDFAVPNFQTHICSVFEGLYTAIFPLAVNPSL